MKQKPTVPIDDTEALRYAGIMGHTYAVTAESDLGNRRVYGETDSASQAVKWARETTGGRAWRRARAGGYARLHRAPAK